VESLKKGGAEWRILPSASTTSIKNVYLTENQERRRVSLLSQADPFRPEDIPENPAGIYHLAGLFRGEIPDSMIAALAEKAPVAVDAQGLLRYREGKNLSFRDWERKKEYLPLISCFKVDAAEAEILTGETDREKAARQLHLWGAKEVMLTHNTEVLVCSGDKIYRAPYTNRSFTGRTGRGDTTFAAYLAWRKNHSIQDSVTFAAALCSIKMETPGPFDGTVDDVMERIRREY
jgi:sugar/nucleoside kinase (ribokinase family)